MILQNEERSEFNFEDVINPASLTFKDQETEAKYMQQRSKTNQTKKNVILTSLFSGGFICLRIVESYLEYILIDNPLKVDTNFYIASFLVGFLSLSLEIVLLAINKVKLLRGFLFIFSLTTVGLVSSYKNSYSSGNPNAYLVPQVIPLYSVSISYAFIYCHNWIAGIVLTSSMNFGCVIYIFIYPSNLLSKLFLSFNYTLSTIAICTCIRFLEFQRRENFYITYQAKLQQQNIRNILMRFPDPIIVSEKGDVLFANEAFLKIRENHNSGSNQLSEPISNEMSIFELDHQKIIENASKLIECNTNETFLSQITSQVEIKEKEFSFKNLLNINWAKFVIDSTKIQFANFNQIIYAIKNITIYYELIEMKSRDKFSRMFVSSISHEFRTNLNIIMGSLENIEFKSQFSENENYSLLNIKNSSSILEILVNNLIDYTMLQDNTFQLNFHSFEVKDFFEELIRIFKNKFEDKSLFFKYKIDIIVPQSIISDSMRIKQILANFISNALKFTMKGGISIIIKKREFEQIIDISIQDSGIGISQENIPKLMKPFSKLDDPFNLNPNGVGLGLHISNMIIQRLGGKIDIESFLNIGSTFTLCLPYLSEHNFSSLSEIKLESNIIQCNAIEKSKLQNLNSNSNNNSILKLEDNNKEYKNDEIDSSRNLKCSCPNVLIVDDEISNRIILSNYCRRSSLLFEEAKNGQEALDKVYTFQNRNKCFCKSYKLILMDSNMPLMSGEEASLKIRSFLKEQENGNFFIVCITANAEINLNTINSNDSGIIYDEIVYKPLRFCKFKQLCELYIENIYS